MFFSFTKFSINGLAEFFNDFEITDLTGDAFGYLDIDSVWFYEDENKPDILYISIWDYTPDSGYGDNYIIQY